jgi:hypothetical protein
MIKIPVLYTEFMDLFGKGNGEPFVALVTPKMEADVFKLTSGLASVCVSYDAHYRPCVEIEPIPNAVDLWKSTCDSLPALNDRVFVYCQDGLMIPAHLESVKAGHSTVWVADDGNENYHLKGVTHWMRLPRPPIVRSE